MSDTPLKDHRQIGQELDLYSFHEYAPGAVFWHPNGWIIYQEIANLIRSMLKNSGYQEIKTPVMVKNKLFIRSGHWQHFGEHNMFNLAVYEDEEVQEHLKSIGSENLSPDLMVHTVSSGNKIYMPKVNYSLKPMNCPESTLIYNSTTRSYRDLPLKFSDFGILHRRELSGTLGGLFRLREFTIDDAHIYCRNDQIRSIVLELLEQIQIFYKLFGFKLDFYLSTKPEKALTLTQRPHLWEEAEEDLRGALEQAKIKYGVKEKDGAFYGPKIDFHIKDSQGRDWQLATIQLDFQMPSSLGVAYINDKGDSEHAVMVHRAFTGSLERFIGILVEHFQGAFPVWLAPVQVVILPVADRHIDAAKKIASELTAAGIRVEVDEKNDTLQNKIRVNSLQKVPFMGIIGDKETDNLVSVRTREGNQESMNLSQFIKKVKEAIDKKI